MISAAFINRNRRRAFSIITRTFSIALILALFAIPDTSSAQIPGISAPPKPVPKADPSKASVQVKETTGEVFTATAGPIHVDQKVSDDDSTVTDVTAFAQKVDGVRLVLNKMKAAAEHAAPQVTPIDHAIKKAEVEAVAEGNDIWN